MTASLAPARLARIALGHVTREYPHKLDHVMAGAGDLVAPHLLHPIFHGSFDWHSCVHGYWLLAATLRADPGGEAAEATRALFDRMLTCRNGSAERAYFERPDAAAFERPYGWAWLLTLHAELERHAAAWADALAPLAQAIAMRLGEYLPRLDYAVRTGTHFNTAFALLLARRWAAPRDAALADLIAARAEAWFGGDADGGRFEPSGDDFLSPALVEAVLMRELWPADRFRPWFERLLPGLAAGEPATLFAPVRVSDRADGKIAHLDGLNLSRAWCWRLLAPRTPDPARARAIASAHLAAALPHLDGDYMGSHWLASFAWLALSDGSDGGNIT